MSKRKLQEIPKGQTTLSFLLKPKVETKNENMARNKKEIRNKNTSNRETGNRETGNKNTDSRDTKSIGKQISSDTKNEIVISSNLPALTLPSEFKPESTTPSEHSLEYYDDLESTLIPSWRQLLKSEFTKSYWKNLTSLLNRDHKSGNKIFPIKSNIFRALNECDFDNVRVVIIGQDPYFKSVDSKTCQAEGLCFSVPIGVKVPPSLLVIYRELSSDLSNPTLNQESKSDIAPDSLLSDTNKNSDDGAEIKSSTTTLPMEFKIPSHGHLGSWCRQGVLLLNDTLTVREGKANTHADFGWSKFTDAIINLLNNEKNNLVFLLWGGFAQKKCRIVDSKRHCVLKAGHPSPLNTSARFAGCKHFSKTNEYLRKNGKREIDWRITN